MNSQCKQTLMESGERRRKIRGRNGGRVRGGKVRRGGKSRRRGERKSGGGRKMRSM